MPYTVPHVAAVPAPETDQARYNASRALTAHAFTAYVKAHGHPQTLTAPTLREAALLALIMHSACAAETTAGLPVIYALPADGGPGVLLPLEGWLPATLRDLEAASRGAYTPHPDIAAAVAAMARRGERTGGGPVAKPAADAALGSHPDATHRRYRVLLTVADSSPRLVGGVSAFDRADAFCEARRIFGHMATRYGGTLYVAEAQP